MTAVGQQEVHISRLSGLAVLVNKYRCAEKARNICTTQLGPVVQAEVNTAVVHRITCIGESLRMADIMCMACVVGDGHLFRRGSRHFLAHHDIIKITGHQTDLMKLLLAYPVFRAMLDSPVIEGNKDALTNHH
jgi:hypothetical protein